MTAWQQTTDEAASWESLASVDDATLFSQHWLALQCTMLEGVTSALVLLRPEGAATSAYRPVAVWPDPTADLSHLGEAAEQALRGRKGILHLPDAEPDRAHVAYPIVVAGELQGAVVLDVASRREGVLQSLLRRLYWGVGRLEARLAEAAVARIEQIDEALAGTLDLVAVIGEHERFRAAARAFVTEIASRLSAERVSLGFSHRGQQHIEAVSYSADFDDRNRIYAQLARAMDEAADQGETVVYPADESAPPQIVLFHEALVREHRDGPVLSIPLRHLERIVGVLCCEWPQGAARPDVDRIRFCESAAALAGPVLEVMRQNEEGIWRRLGRVCSGALRRLAGEGHYIAKTVTAGLVVLALFLSLAKGDYEVTAPAHLEGRVLRAAVAPVDGFLAKALVRAGETVETGQLLAELDDRDLIKERQRLESRIAQVRGKQRDAMAAHKRADVAILSAELRQAHAELALVEARLERLSIRAPFAGLVVSGDLSQKLGAPVERGETLFEIAPAGDYRVVVDADERDIDDLRIGLRGRLSLTALPAREWPIELTLLTPVATARDGRNFFRVEARLDETADFLRPGMEGVARIDAGERRLIWIWGHRLLDWWRLWWWTWWP